LYVAEQTTPDAWVKLSVFRNRSWATPSTSRWKLARGDNGTLETARRRKLDLSIDACRLDIGRGTLAGV
jgi:hypothetical protein